MGSYITNYQQVAGSGLLRSRLRHHALNLLSVSNGLIDPKVSRIQFLFFHHVFQDEELAFEELLDHLSKEHMFLSYSEGVEKIRSGKIDGSYIVWSSDDGFKNNLAAADILERFGISACFFVNPGSIGITDFPRAEKFCAQRLNLPAVEFLNWDEVLSLQARGHEIGSHTINHLNVAELGGAQLQDEIFLSKQQIEKYCGEVRHFAYPYGGWSDFTSKALQSVANADYLSCATGERGCHTIGSTSTGIPVINRDLVIANWPIKHIEYFMRRNVSLKANQTLPWK